MNVVQEAEIFDAGNAAKVNERAKSAKAKELQRLDGLRQTMQSKNGRFWMYKFLSDCGCFSVSFNGNSRDYFNLGMRNAGMMILGEITVHFIDDYILMLKEGKDNV